MRREEKERDLRDQQDADAFGVGDDSVFDE